MGETRPTDREAVSLKYAFYLLAGAADKFPDQYPVLEKLRQHDSEAFRQKIRTGLLQLLRKVKAWIFQNFEPHWKIERLHVRIPAQWDHEFRIPFRALLAEVFEWNEHKAFDIVSFLQGADSDAHALLNRPVCILGKKPKQLWLFLHYGGHSMVCGFVVLAWWMRTVADKLM